MPKHTRKRKSESEIDVEYQVMLPKNKFKSFDAEPQIEEEKLTEILFGGSKSFLKSLEEAERESPPSCSNIDSGVGEDDSEDGSHKELAPAWIDEEDDGIEVGAALNLQGRKLPNGGINSRRNKYSNLLKHKFNSTIGNPKWASLEKNKQDNSDSDDDILQSCGFVKKNAKEHLPPTTVEFKKVKDLNWETYSEGPFINAVEFHTSSSVALVAGNSSVATLYAVDGRRNNKLHSVKFNKFPIICAKFSPGGNEALLGSRLNYIYSYDLMAAQAVRIPLPTGLTQFKNFVTSPDSKFIAAAGKWGEVHVLSSLSKERIFTLKQDSEVTALAFNPEGNFLFGHSDSGMVTVWDVNMRKVRCKWFDDGCLQGTAITASLSNQFVATGSAQGVVNVYSTEDLFQSKTPKPHKTVLNLTTSISSLKFNSSSEMLALASSDIENSIRLLHLGSGTVFNNFPSFGSKLGFINALNFSPGDGYLALGNKKSIVSLYRLKHYKNY